MSKTFTVNGTDYTFPEQGASPPWGTEVTDWAQAVTDTLSNVVGSGDVLNTQFLFNNNQSSASNITGLTFDVAVVRGTLISYAIYRSTSSSELAECGTLYAVFKNTANSWEIAQSCVGDSEFVFSVTSTGQFQYTTSNLAGTGHVGRIRFSAKSFTQT